MKTLESLGKQGRFFHDAFDRLLVETSTANQPPQPINLPPPLQLIKIKQTPREFNLQFQNHVCATNHIPTAVDAPREFAENVAEVITKLINENVDHYVSTDRSIKYFTFPMKCSVSVKDFFECSVCRDKRMPCIHNNVVANFSFKKKIRNDIVV